MQNPVLILNRVTRVFEQAGGTSLSVLRGVNLVLESGEVVALLGPSGSGKSTLLQVAGLLEPPTGGDVVILGQQSQALGDAARTRLRRSTLGFVYQFHHLLKEFSARENVMMPQLLAGVPRRVARERADALLAEVGLSDRAGHRPAALSGGQQQRVAVARALANQPKLLLADEPTGNLDPETAGALFDLLMRLAREAGMAALVATHNMALAQAMDRTVRLEAGLLDEA